MSADLTREQYRLLQYSLTELFVEHLLDVSRVFGGDLQEVVVLAMIGQVYMHGDEQGRDNAPITASRLADVTGIPRQTVRRKLHLLKQRGWIYQTETGAWQLVEVGKEAVARDDLAELDARGTERLFKLVRKLRDHV